ncbi:MAG: hypothetical protein G01um101420_834 [Parcubacteria group bacterium Gr01-1014_20]|nr:MAG: hypothetical protein G01um101420_834 [Parcubacteria group bacterium Gr01-1014_20]
MILSVDRAEILRLSCNDCKTAILERRNSIRSSRDQRGDDRCFMDDWLLWKWLSDSPPEPTAFRIEWGMEQCALFYEHRRMEQVDPVPKDAILDSAHWDDDLEAMALNQLHDELVRIQEALRAHRDIKDRPRTLKDDQVLYQILPEKILADFRLPPKEEFLGEYRSPHAGCPAFWRSHSQCDTKCHNLHQWGPCK